MQKRNQPVWTGDINGNHPGRLGDTTNKPWQTDLPVDFRNCSPPVIFLSLHGLSFRILDWTYYNGRTLWWQIVLFSTSIFDLFDKATFFRCFAYVYTYIHLHISLYFVIYRFFIIYLLHFHVSNSVPLLPSTHAFYFPTLFLFMFFLTLNYYPIF